MSSFSLSFSSDDILQSEGGPLYAAEIGSELQKQFAILPGWFDCFLSWPSHTLQMWGTAWTRVTLSQFKYNSVFSPVIVEEMLNLSKFISYLLQLQTNIC